MLYTEKGLIAPFFFMKTMIIYGNISASKINNYNQ